MDLIVPVRRTVTIRLRASAGVVALVPAGSIFGERVTGQTYPFIRVDLPTVTPMRGQCDPDGQAVAFSVHAFVQGASADKAGLVAAAIKAEFGHDRSALQLEDGTVLSVQWTGGGILSDPDEKNTWHVYVEFTAA